MKWNWYPETEPEESGDYLVAVAQTDTEKRYFGIDKHQWVQSAYFDKVRISPWSKAWGSGFTVYAWRKLPPVPRKKLSQIVAENQIQPVLAQSVTLDHPA